MTSKKSRKKKKIGLVLSGGGAGGWLQIGVVQKLVEWNVPIDIVVGTSIGAFWGATIASGMPIPEIIERGKKYKGSDFMEFNFNTKSGLFDPKNVMKKWIEDCGDLRFEDLPKKLGLVTTDLETGEEVIITSGSVAKAVRASITDYPIIKPVRIKNRFLIDGVFVNPLPIDVAYKLGADFVIAVDCIDSTTGKVEYPKKNTEK